ncbi:MAG: shikimate kinase [Coriobacteriaceae bacterium]|jgi:shikimate kinase|nr:shikimate kinase [Coriobacteriaceae bacterium]
MEERGSMTGIPAESAATATRASAARQEEGTFAPEATPAARHDKAAAALARVVPGEGKGPKGDNIILIGMPGAGKSTLGIVLAKIINFNFLDADLVIQNRCDKTLQKIIDACGPEGFIELENEILQDLTASSTIIATGGSAVYSSEAMGHLKTLGTVVYLQISYDEMVKRLHDLHERGVVLKGGISMSLRDLYDERKPLYEGYADITIDIDDLSITAAARKIAAALPCTLQ